MQELKGTESELRQLLTASNARNEEMELQAFEQAEQFEKLKLELDNVTQGNNGSLTCKRLRLLKIFPFQRKRPLGPKRWALNSN